MQGFPFQPEQASTIARSVDYLYYFITAVTLFFTALIFSVIFYFMIKYRRRSPDERPKAIEGSIPLEILWTAIPTLIVAIIFVWSSSLYFRNSEPPAGATEIFVTGKQWMWKVEHPEGQREINELHVPLGRPIKLTMTSEDVIHDFFVPAFRVKKDVLPGRYTTLWFEPTKPGTFHLFCAQYCGAFHAGMIGSVIVMEPDEYERWLAGGVLGESMEAAGQKVFQQSGCGTCHLDSGTGLGPSLLGVYGQPVRLTNGQTVTADDAYIRESILSPAAKIVLGYTPIMPTFQGQLTEEQLNDLIAYIQLLGKEQAKPKEGEAMSTATLEPRVQAPRNYLNADYGWKSWLFTLDHKRIALLYLVSITFFFIIGGSFAVLMRIQLVEPQGALVQPETYNKFFTLHGIIMVFFFLIPSIPAVLGNFLVPLMVGARDVAFPKLNLLSWYIYIVGGLFTLYSAAAGGVDTGWTFYTPYSSTYSNTQVTAVAIGVFITGFSSILTGLNFIVTIHKMRAPGLTWFRMPLFLWAIYSTSVIMVLGTPVLAITLFLLALEHLFHVGIFSPALGGDPLLFQHLFWFYSHPAVYIMILPAMGVVSEIIACFARKRIFGYKVVAFSSVAIAVLGFLVWGHHMFVTGQSVYEGLIFSLLSFLVAIPSAIKVFNWTATLYKGSISYEAPMLYAMGFIGLFTMGGLTGLFLASLATDVHLNGTYFVVAHFHYIMVGGAVMGYLGGIHFWWPKISGRKYPNGWAALAAAIIFIGFNLTFFPQFLLGYLGMPRRYAFYPAEFQVLNVMSSAGATVLGVGYLIPLVYLIWSMRYGPIAEPNPWGATGLEWRTSSPPPTENFAEIPVVTQEAYAYAEEEASGD